MHDGARRRSPSRRAGALAPDAEGARPSPDRRPRRGADDLAARAARRDDELGLPLLLAAGRDVHPDRAGRLRLHRGSLRLARLDPAGGRRGAGQDADHVPRRRLAPARRGRARLAVRLSLRPAGARRQRRGRPVPARRLRRADPHAARVRAGRHGPHGTGTPSRTRHRRLCRADLAGTGFRACGKAAAGRGTTPIPR